MKHFIQITRHPYEEPYQLNLVIMAGNGLTQGALEFYLDPTNLEQIGNALIDFPKHANSRHLFTKGSEYREDGFAWYLRLYFKALMSLENCAIQIRMNNNREPLKSVPVFETPQIVDFYLLTDSARLQELGRLLREFANLEHYRLYWDDEAGYLDNATQKYQGQKPNPSINPLEIAAQALHASI